MIDTPTSFITDALNNINANTDVSLIIGFGVMAIFALTISMYALTSLAVFAFAKPKCFVQSRNRGTLKGNGKTATKGKRIAQTTEKKRAKEAKEAKRHEANKEGMVFLRQLLKDARGAADQALVVTSVSAGLASLACVWVLPRLGWDNVFMLPLIPAIILLVLCMYQVCLCGLDRHVEGKLDQISTLQQRGKLCSTALGPWSWWLCRRSQWWCDNVTDYLECSSLVAMPAVASLAGPAVVLVHVMTTDTGLAQAMVKMAKSAWARRTLLVLLVIRTLATSTLTQPACGHFVAEAQIKIGAIPVWVPAIVFIVPILVAFGISHNKAKEDRLSSAAPSLEREVTDHPPHSPGNLSSPCAPLSPKPKSDAAIAAADVKPVNTVGVQLLTLFVLLVVVAMIGSLYTNSDPNSYPTTVDCVPSWSPWTSFPKSCGTGIKTLPKGLAPPFPFTLLKYVPLATTADPNAFPAAAPLLQMGTHAAVLPQTISDPAPPAPAQQSRSTMAAEEASPPHEAGALASNVLPQTASNSAPSARYAAQVSTTMWCAVMHSIQINNK